MEVSNKDLKLQKRFHVKQYEDSIKNIRTKIHQKLQMTVICLMKLMFNLVSKETIINYKAPISIYQVGRSNNAIKFW